MENQSGSAGVIHTGMTKDAPEQVLSALNAHLIKHPESQAEDVYKFIYQAFHGISHFIPSRQHAIRYLEDEISSMSLKAGDSSGATESLGPFYARLNLKPYIIRGGSIEVLVDSMIECANLETDTSSFVHTIELLIERSTAPGWTGPGKTELETLIGALKASNWPAVHHSDRFRELYHPHYRILTHTQVISLLQSLDSMK